MFGGITALLYCHTLGYYGVIKEDGQSTASLNVHLKLLVGGG